MREWLRFPIRTSAFLGKEAFEVLRQPRLALTLVLGPFLILLLVGVGYRNEPRTFRTLFVAESDAAAALIGEYASDLGPGILNAGVIRDPADGRARLRNGQVDLLVVAPPGTDDLLGQDEPIAFEIYHNEIDPLQAGYIDFVGRFYIEEINRRVLRVIVAEAQTELGQVQTDLAETRATTQALHAALARGEAREASAQHQRLSEQMTELDAVARVSAALLGGATSQQGAGWRDRWLAVTRDSEALGEIPSGCATCARQAEQVAALDADLAELERLTSEMRARPPDLWVSPFRSESYSVLPVQPRMIDFFAPAVLALLLQHLAITFGALSIVREKRLGTVELFRVSPLSAGEAVVGKYLGNFLFGAGLAAVLTALLLYTLGVPMLGRWQDYALIMAGLLFTSLGVGFVISLVAQTESQAVQYAMLVLMASIFLGGLFVNTQQLWPPVQAVAWALPVTYGVNLLQQVMLRGIVPNPLWLGGLIGIGVLFLVLTWLLMRRLMMAR